MNSPTTRQKGKKDKNGINISQGSRKKRRRLFKKLTAGITKKLK